MLTLSFWAKNHPVQARWLIAVNRTLLGVLSFLWGVLLTGGNPALFNIFFAGSAAVFLLGWFGYPRIRDGVPRRRSYMRQKCCDCLLVLSSCLFYAGAGNFLPQRLSQSTAPSAVQYQVLQSAISKKDPAEYNLEKHGGFFQKIKMKGARMFQKVKTGFQKKANFIQQAAKGLKTGTVILLVLASLAIFAVIGYFTAILSCSASCNGQEGLAAVILTLGLAAIVGLIYLIWRAAVRKNRRRQASGANPNRG